MSPDSLRHPGIIKTFGRSIKSLRLLKDERESSPPLLQAVALADECPEKHPACVRGLAWRGELACWLDAPWEADEYAERVWRD
jgi:hypothetical protein